MNAQINQKTKENIKEVEDFIYHLKMNFKNHSQIAKNTDDIEDYENSASFLKDYAEVSEELVKVIKNYYSTH